MGKWKSICFGRYFSSLRTFFLEYANFSPKNCLFSHFYLNMCPIFSNFAPENTHILYK